MSDTSTSTVQALPYVDGHVPGEPGPGEEVDALGTPIAQGDLRPLRVTRRRVGYTDVQVDILYTGICHSDIHFVNNDWGNTIFPCVPGHEIVGRVSVVGDGVTRFKAGDMVAVGPIVNNCGRCANCSEGLEQYCTGPHGRTEIYNGPTKPDGTNTYGGYSTRVVVGERYVYSLPEGLKPETVPPLMCAGITTYSPLKFYGVGPGKKVGVAGLGGLGHIAVKLAAAMGAEVTVLSRSPEKEADAKRFGAEQFVLHTNPEAMAELEQSLDFVLVTIPEPFDVNPFVSLLKRDGTVCVVGAIEPLATPTNTKELTGQRRAVSGSILGGVDESAEMLEFCAANGIESEVEVIPFSDVNDAYPKVRAGKVRYRYVIDVAGSAV